MPAQTTSRTTGTGGSEAIAVFTRSEVVEAIMREMAASGRPIRRHTADYTIEALERGLRHCRRHPRTVYYFSQQELDRCHHVLDAVMPDDTAAAPGSAYAALNRLLLRGREISLTHTQTDRDGEPGILHCSMHAGLLVA